MYVDDLLLIIQATRQASRNINFVYPSIDRLLVRILMLPSQSFIFPLGLIEEFRKASDQFLISKFLLFPSLTWEF